MRCPHCSRRIGGGIPNSIPESQRRTIEERVISLTEDVARDHFLAEGRRQERTAVIAWLRGVNKRESINLASWIEQGDHLKAGDAPTGDER